MTALRSAVQLPPAALALAVVLPAAGLREAAWAQGNPARGMPARPATENRAETGEAASDAAAGAQPRNQSRPAAPPRQTVERKRASELIQVQEAPKISTQLFERMTPDSARIVVSLSKQRAFLISNDQIVIDTPVSTGKRAGWTPTGDFTILQKNKDHRSNIYGSYVDSKGRVVRSGISTRIDSAPSGTRFLGSPMRHFMRLTWTGIGLHEGELPGYPASHGCVRLPGHIAEMIYSKVVVGTPVSIIP